VYTLFRSGIRAKNGGRVSTAATLVSSEPPSPLGVVPPPPPPVVGVVLVLDSSVLVVGWGVDVGSFVNEAVVAAAGLIGGDVVVLASPGVPAITKKAATYHNDQNKRLSILLQIFKVGLAPFGTVRVMRICLCFDSNSSTFSIPYWVII
jgi:hypothetical protein